MKRIPFLVVFLVGSVFLCALLTFATQAHALLITPGLKIDSGDEFNMPDVWEEIEGTISPLDPKKPLYKSEVEGGSEEGPLSGSYETEYFNEPDDPAEATITWVLGTPFIGPESWLLVKDGQHTPGWYLFDLDSLGWDGMEDVVLEDFWPDGGAISNLGLYGTTPVPEPATMLLLGSGLIGIAVVGRKKFLKKS